MKPFARSLPWIDLGTAWVLVLICVVRQDYYVCMVSAIAVVTLWRAQTVYRWMDITQHAIGINNDLLKLNDHLLAVTQASQRKIADIEARLDAAAIRIGRVH